MRHSWFTFLPQKVSYSRLKRKAVSWVMKVSGPKQLIFIQNDILDNTCGYKEKHNRLWCDKRISYTN